MTKILKLPGLVDTHVHLREPGWEYKEDFTTGTKAAIAGGYTQVLDMPNNPTPIISKAALENKIKLAKGRIYADLGFHFGGSPDAIKEFKKVYKKTFGLKVYMNHTTGPLLVENQNDLEKIFSSWPKEKVIMVHAEGDTLKKAILLAKQFKRRLHVCHVSLKMQVDLIRKAKKEKVKISCEVGCHHLFLTDEDVKRLKNYGMMRPPLATKKDQKALWKGINDGTIDTIASDHAPHTKQEKEDKTKVVNGVPGLETSLPLLLTALSKGKLSKEKLIALTSKNPRKIFNLPKQENTWVEIDLDKSYVIKAKSLYTKCGWTPFEEMKVKGAIKRVILRGQVVFENGKILEKAKGKVIFPI